MNESFIFYASFFEALNCFDDEHRLKLFDSICNYALYGIAPSLTDAENALFLVIKALIDNNFKKRQRDKANGSKGGRPKNLKVLEGLEAVNLNANVNENVNENEKEIYCSLAEKAPTLDECREYVLKKNYSVNADEFYSYYAMRNWMSGTQRIEDWKKAVDWWQEKNKHQQKKRLQEFDERNWTEEEYNKTIHDPLREYFENEEN